MSAEEGRPRMLPCEDATAPVSVTSTHTHTAGLAHTHTHTQQAWRTHTQRAWRAHTHTHILSHTHTLSLTHTHTRARALALSLSFCGPGTGENQAYAGGMMLPCPLAIQYSRQQTTGICRMREGINPAVISKQQRADLAILRGRRILFYIPVMNI